MPVTVSEKIRFIERVFGSGRLARNGKNIDVRCPICNPSDKTKRKLAIRVDDTAVHCWTCGFRSKTIASLVKKFANRELVAEYNEKLAEKNHKLLDELSVEVVKVSLPNDFKLLATASDGDPDVRLLKKYVIDRGLIERDLWYFKLGYSEEHRWKRRIIMPSFDADGEINYFVGRAIDKFRRPKYDNPDADKLPIIFNELNIDFSKRLVMCEGPFDAIKCGDNVVPLLGSEINSSSALFLKIIANKTPIALALDPDCLFTKAIKVAKLLASHGISVDIVDVRPHEDPGSMTRDQFQIALDSAKQFDWDRCFDLKLQNIGNVSLRM